MTATFFENVGLVLAHEITTLFLRHNENRYKENLRFKYSKIDPTRVQKLQHSRSFIYLKSSLSFFQSFHYTDFVIVAICRYIYAMKIKYGNSSFAELIF